LQVLFSQQKCFARAGWQGKGQGSINSARYHVQVKSRMAEAASVLRVDDPARGKNRVLQIHLARWPMAWAFLFGGCFGTTCENNFLFPGLFFLPFLRRPRLI
jgi:hypothetical protein